MCWKWWLVHCRRPLLPRTSTLQEQQGAAAGAALLLLLLLLTSQQAQHQVGTPQLPPLPFR